MMSAMSNRTNGLIMKITRIRIGLILPKKLRLQIQLDRLLGGDEAPPTPPEDANNYWAEAIEDGDKFYYRVDGITIEIPEGQFCEVVINPSLYYFSTALKLHCRIQQASKENLLPS